QLWDIPTHRPLGPPVVQLDRLLGVAFAADGKSFLTTAADGSTRSWPVPQPLPGQDLGRLALRLQGAPMVGLDPGQVLTRLTLAEWRQRHQQLVEQEGAAAVPLAPPLPGWLWHDARARDAEQDGNAFAARWHLDRLLAGPSPPPEYSVLGTEYSGGGEGAWLLYARRARLRIDAGDRALAEADYQHAAELRPPPAPAAWYRQQAWAYQRGGRPEASLWYLNHR